MTKNLRDVHHFPEVGVPYFWPLGLALGMNEFALDVLDRNLKFLAEVTKTQIERESPQWTTKNRAALDLHTLVLRDFSRGTEGRPVLVLPPYAGHSSTIADFAEGQSLVAALLDGGCERVFATDWKSATPKMRDYDIDTYLAELNVCVDDLGGKVALIGLCQGGWCAAMYAARYPEKVERLVLAGAPIDTSAGDGAIERAAHTLPMQFYERLVQLGDGVLKGAFMLRGFKNMHPAEQYVQKFVELYAHADDPGYVARFEKFERWYEYTLNLPGAWYLQVIQQLFKENQLARGQFVGLGKKLDLKAVTCPTYLIAGDRDDITPQAQVFNAEKLLGTKPSDIHKMLAHGGHIGLFMSSSALEQIWPKVARWMVEPAAGHATAPASAPDH